MKMVLLTFVCEWSWSQNLSIKQFPRKTLKMCILSLPSLIEICRDWDPGTVIWKYYASFLRILYMYPVKHSYITVFDEVFKRSEVVACIEDQGAQILPQILWNLVTGRCAYSSSLLPDFCQFWNSLFLWMSSILVTGLKGIILRWIMI